MTWSIVPSVSGDWTVVSDASVTYASVSDVSTTFTEVGIGPGYVRAGYVESGYIEPDAGHDWSEADSASTTWS